MKLPGKRALFGSAILLVVISATALWWISAEKKRLGDPGDPAQVLSGRDVYNRYCASCHGNKLQGEPNWQRRKVTGRLPAPPHDASGHTWHHPDAQLFGITKNGIGPYAPAGYQSDMLAFGNMLSDEQIWAVLAYIKSTWPKEIQEQQREVSKARP